MITLGILFRKLLRRERTLFGMTESEYWKKEQANKPFKVPMSSLLSKANKEPRDKPTP